ncbi:C45 family autoproteolytic acyltransferase/hydolase [Alteribacter natronophilus]|uniref:C45 family autoproteolytic acyltransferase/hydolase n=1 Tax=Alteribacter natronophilus TaxID=2583810 RepID=UPI001FEB1FDC|nr:C45 family peptidase [Alteribacter natronophilus]
MDIQVDVTEGRGSPYRFGVMQGEKIKHSKLYPVHAKRRKKSLKSYTADIKEAEKMFMHFAPEIWEELEGAAEGLGWSLEDTVHEYGGYQQDWVKSGCSSIMYNGLYGRNYDYHPKTYDGRFVLWQPDRGKGYSIIGFAQRVVGRMDGMNEKGLAAGYHFVNRLRPSDGFICTTIARMILSRCTNVGDAVHMLKEIPHRHAFNYSLMDSSGDRAVVEASGKGVEVRRNSSSGCTNHFEEKKGENRHRTGESVSRLHLLEDYSRDFSGSKSPAGDLFSVLNDEKRGVAKREYGNWSGTIHTAVYDTVNLSATVGVGIDSHPVTISFSEWLNGKPLRIKKVNGLLPWDGEVTHLQKQGGSSR